MDEQFNLGEFNRILKAAATTKYTTKKMEQKEQDKLWPEIRLPLRLSDALDMLTKSEMLLTRKHMDIAAGSHLKKQDIQSILEQRMPESIDRVVKLMDHKRYRLLQKIVRQRGHIPASKLESGHLDYFRRRGLFFTGTVDGAKTFVMPQEVLDNLQSIDRPEYHAVVDRNTEWIRLTHGLLFYHGTLYLDQLEDLIGDYAGAAGVEEDYLDVLLDSLTYYDAVREDSFGFSNHRVPNPQVVIQEHQMRPTVGSFPFTKEQLLQAAESGFIDRNPSHIAFADHIYDNYDVTRNEADAYAGECAYGARCGESLGNVAVFMQNKLAIDTIEEIQTLADRLMIFMNHTKQWALKGYAPSELSALTKKPPVSVQTREKADVFDFATRQKVGRNDPCPCGSGKKFKKCCNPE